MDVEGTYTVYSPVDESCVFGGALTVTEAADVMLTAGPITNCAASCGADRGNYGSQASKMSLAAVSVAKWLVLRSRRSTRPLSEAWPEIADMIAHADLWPHVAPVTTDEDYVALIEGAEI
jgi:hypothetical protein